MTTERLDSGDGYDLLQGVLEKAYHQAVMGERP